MAFGSRDAFDYFECTGCGCIQIAEVPLDPGRFYPDEYYTRVPDADARRPLVPPSRLRSRWTDGRLESRRFGRLLAGRRYGRFDWFTRTGTRREDAILDVGCGSGRLLRRLHREGFANLTGIDPALGCPAAEAGSPRFFAESLEAHSARIGLDSDRSPSPYRLVMAHHSFEHVEDPRHAFGSLARLVAPGGWLLLRIPVADSWACRHYRENWVQLDAPRHLHLHTRRSVELLCAAEGFDLVRAVDDSGPFQVWGSELYRRGVALTEARSERRRFWGRESPIPARLRARWLRQKTRGDQACFYLQRDPERGSSRST